MNYANSFRKVFTFTATGTDYSPWFDISMYNEIYSYLQFEESGTSNAETIDVTLERASGFKVDVPVTVLTHTQATAATTEEKYGVHHDGSAQGAENKLGTRVRFKCVAGGTFGANTITVTMVLFAKRN